MSGPLFRMNRSQSQVLRAYAPGALFTYEGGGVACMAVPDNENREIAREVLSDTNRSQIAAVIAEYAQAWLDRGMGGTKRLDPRPTTLCIDEEVLDDARERVDLRPGNLRFQSPEYASFVPFPLSFRCARCDLHRQCESPETVADDMARFREACPSRGQRPCADNWLQLDFVMAHWSGEVESPSPLRREWANGREARLDMCSNCDRKTFRWVGIGTGTLSAIRLACVHCNEPRDLLMKDPHTLRVLGAHLGNGAVHAEINMEPVSYRARAVHYPHGDRMLLFTDDGTMRKLDANRRGELARFLVDRHGFPVGAELPEARKRELLERDGRGLQWSERETHLATIASLETLPGTEAACQALRKRVADIEAEWMRDVFAAHSGTSSATEEAIDARTTFPTRYDPIRMAVEHAAFLTEKVSATRLDDGRFRSVKVTQLDEFTTPDGLDPLHGLDRVHAASQGWLDLMGIEEMRIVRDIRVCDFTFGYTRTESSPHLRRVKAGDLDMPVRLRFYPKVRVETPGSGEPPKYRFPVLTVVSSNEGIYVRLKAEVVEEWVRANGFALPTPDPGMSLGGRLIAQACAVQAASGVPEPPGRFHPFLDGFKREGATPPIAYPHVYTLLHTMAHCAVIQASALSGLDLSSFAEHLFVPDLAFLIYRRGTTMDLANLSSMWRDRGSEEEGNEFLARMAAPAALRCGSEGSCVQRGGACPDCVMIPETSCITRNELLSRSALIGRGKPHWAALPGGARETVGYYEVIDRLREREGES